jgi:hypothetical protein
VLVHLGQFDEAIKVLARAHEAVSKQGLSYGD